MSIPEMQQERKRATRWVRDLTLEAVHTIVDAMVLGDFDWREWLDTRPSSVFVNAIFTEVQYREEIETTY